MADKKLVCIGKIITTHGVRGDVVLKSFTDTPAAFFDYTPHTDASGHRHFVFSRKGLTQKGFIVNLKGITDRDMAKDLKGTEIFTSRDNFPIVDDPDAFYNEDLLGLTVRVENTDRKGRVVAVQDHGAGAYLDIQWNDGITNTLPFTREAVPTVALDEGYIIVNPDLMT